MGGDNECIGSRHYCLALFPSLELSALRACRWHEYEYQYQRGKCPDLASVYEIDIVVFLSLSENLLTKLGFPWLYPIKIVAPISLNTNGLAGEAKADPVALNEQAIYSHITRYYNQKGARARRT